MRLVVYVPNPPDLPLAQARATSTLEMVRRGSNVWQGSADKTCNQTDPVQDTKRLDGPEPSGSQEEGHNTFLKS